MSYSLAASSQLLGSYLHQDWVDEFVSESDVVEAMKDGETKEHIDEARRELEALVQSSLTETQLREIMTDQVGCYFEPSSKGMSYREWLADLITQLGKPSARG